jgi:transposase
MVDYSELYVGFDTSKLHNAVAIAQAGRQGEIRYLGEIENTSSATSKLVRQLAGKYGRLTFCYEAGPTGYGLYRQLTALGYECQVVAPSLIPKRAGDRVKTNRRDAVSLAKLLRAGELTPVWVPDERHEAMRDLVRAREVAVGDLRAKHQQITAFLLRLGRIYPGKKTWTQAHMAWVGRQKLAYDEQNIVLEEQLIAAQEAQSRIKRLEGAIHAAVPTWSMAKLVEALTALRGIDVIAAIGILTELGDLSRFHTPSQLMAYLGLVPSEASTGDKVRRGSITKAGNIRARHLLVECAWSYRYPPRFSQAKLAKLDATLPSVAAIARTAQSRLCKRYRALIAKGKRKTVAITAVARELAGFVWAVCRTVATAP